MNTYAPNATYMWLLDYFGLSDFLATSCRSSNLRLRLLHFEQNLRECKPSFYNLDAANQYSEIPRFFSKFLKNSHALRINCITILSSKHGKIKR